MLFCKILFFKSQEILITIYLTPFKKPNIPVFCKNLTFAALPLSNGNQTTVLWLRGVETHSE